MPHNDDSPNGSGRSTDRATLAPGRTSSDASGPGSPPSRARVVSRREALRLGMGALAAGTYATGLFGGRAHALEPSGEGSAPLPGAPPRSPLSRDLILKTIPASGEEVPAIGMGTWQTFMVEPREEELAPLREVLRVFHESGGRVVDSSPMYGNAEEVTGDLAADLGLLDEFWVATKVWTEGREEGIAQMQQSMSELRRRDRIELMQVHNLVDVEVHLETLEEWKAQGRFRYIGITNTSAQRYPRVEALLEDERLDFVQTNYSLAERQSAERILPKARERGIGVVVARPFAGGNLFPRVRDRPLPDWAAEFDCTAWSQFFLKYIVSHPAVTCAIPATSNPDHMRENMGACRGRLPDEPMRRRMEELIDSL
jgi:aryl-alcohol dehydrogenase-like predicted oxidoreductase